MPSFPTVRLRRLRNQPRLRAMVRENNLQRQHLIHPLFVHHQPDMRRPLESLPDTYQLGINHLAEEIDQLVALGVPAVLLFGIPSYKDARGSEAYGKNSIISQAIHLIKQRASQLLVITDLCFCAYTDHGHCGVLTSTGEPCVDNDASLPLLVRQAIIHADAGSDMIAPSGMLDGMVSVLRTGLDRSSYSQLPILSYAAKFSSSFYQPFRVAAEGAPKEGNRAGYQLDPANLGEALHEVDLDITEGADMIIIKPAHTYLDVIANVHRSHPSIPLVAYHVSGECALLKAAGQNDWVDEQAAVMEVLLSMKRAGAQLIVTYYAKKVAAWLMEK